MDIALICIFEYLFESWQLAAVDFLIAAKAGKYLGWAGASPDHPKHWHLLNLKYRSCK